MAEQLIKVPDIGDANDVDVVEILVSPGSRVDKEQSLIVLESEKASMEIPSPAAGTVKSVMISVGAKVSEGADILMLEVAADGEEAEAKKQDSPKSEPQPTEQRSRNDELPPPPPSDAAEDEADAEDAPASDDAKSAQAADAGPSSATMASRTIPPLPAPSLAPAKEGQSTADLPHATPSVRKLARELGVNLSQVTPSGPHDRITKEDVQGHVKKLLSGAGAVSGPGYEPAPAIDFSQFGPTRTESLTKIQKLTGRNTHRSWVTIPHVTQFDTADITEVEAFRKELRKERPDVKLTLVAFVMKALARVLKEMPRFNASLDPSGETLILKDYVHIGVAVDTEAGLVVPVIRDVDKKGIVALAQELTETSEKARKKRLSPKDMQGASISVSSLGGVGGTAFTPIINPPEVAILGVSRATMQPVYVDGTFVPRLLCPLSLSYDHRVIDGAAAARFTSELGRVLGDMRRALL